MFCSLNVTASYMNNGGFWLAPITYNLQFHLKYKTQMWQQFPLTLQVLLSLIILLKLENWIQNWFLLYMETCFLSFFVVKLKQIHIDKGITAGYSTNILQCKVVAIQTGHAYVSWNLQILLLFQQHILALLPLFSSYISSVYRPSRYPRSRLVERLHSGGEKVTFFPIFKCVQNFILIDLRLSKKNWVKFRERFGGLYNA